MVHIRFYPLDATYRVIEGKPVIHLYGRTEDGKQILVIDKNFKPYFYVSTESDVRKKIEDLKIEKDDDKFFVTRVIAEEKKLLEKEIKVLKVYVNLPNGITLIKDLAREIKGVRTYEYDINYANKYLIDKGITPMTATEVEGEEISLKSKVPAYEVKNISAAGGQSIKELNVLAFDIEVYNPIGRTVLADKHPITMIAFYGNNYKKILTWKKFDTSNKDIEFLSSEADMLQRFKEIIEEVSPDMICGYYSDGFDFPYVKRRAQEYGMKLDLGLDYGELTIRGRTEKNAYITGIVHIDVLAFVRRIIGTSLDTDTYTLNAVANEMLGEVKDDVDIESFAKRWDANDNLEEYAEYNLQDAKLTFDLCLKIMPNLQELVKIVGVMPYELNRMSYSRLVEWYILKQAKMANEMAPNKPRFHERERRREYRIKGAFVFEPQPGLYKDIVVYDYRSLYPTIIASHNISPGTRNCDCCPDAVKIPIEDENWRYCKKKKGFLSGIIEDIIMRRSRVKEIMKDNKGDKSLEARSMALKLLANSFYGYLAFFEARWYFVEGAESTTALGRHYIKKVIAEANEEKFNVLYSDTDSIFLTLEGKTKEDATKFVEKVNKELPGIMELEFEGFYPSGLFVGTKSGTGGAKKKYALADEHGHLKITGFESVRRNTSLVAKEIQEKVLRMVLVDNAPEEAMEYVKRVIQDLKDKKIDVEKLIITTVLKKPVEEYLTVGPHVAAAQRMIDQGKEAGPGTFVKYVIVKGKGKIRDKVRLPEEAKPEDIDSEYYIDHQVIPAVEKILDVFGYSKEKIAKKEGQAGLDAFI